MKRTIQTSGGFTLVELMVAVFVGSIVIWGIYSIYTGSQSYCFSGSSGR